MMMTMNTAILLTITLAEIYVGSLAQAFWKHNMTTELHYDDSLGSSIKEVNGQGQPASLMNTNRPAESETPISFWSNLNWRFLKRMNLRPDEKVLLVLGPRSWVLAAVEQIMKKAVLGSEDKLLLVSTGRHIERRQLIPLIPLGARVALLQMNEKKEDEELKATNCRALVVDVQLQPGGRYDFRSVGCWSHGTLRLREDPMMPLRHLGWANVSLLYSSLTSEITITSDEDGRLKFGGPIGQLMEMIIPKLKMTPHFIDLKIPVLNKIFRELNEKHQHIALFSSSFLPDRNQVIDFSEWYYIHANKFITRNPRTKEEYSFLLFQIYHWKVWCSILALLAFSSLFLSSVWSTDKGDYWILGNRVKDAFCITWKAALYIGSKRLPISTPGRTTLISTWLVIIMLVSVYSGNLIAFLSIPRIEKVPNSAREIIDMGYTLSIEHGYAQYSYLKNSPVEDIQYLFHQHAEVRPRDKGGNTPTSVMDRLFTERFAVLEIGFQTDYLFDKYADNEGHIKVCKLKLSSEPLYIGVGGMIFRKNSLLKPLMDKMIVWIRSSKIISKSSRKCLPPILERKQAKALDLRPFIGVLILWSLGMVIASAAFAVELGLHSLKDRNI